MVILWQDCYGKGSFEKILLKHGCKKIPNWECLFVHRQKGLFLSVYVDDINLAGKKQNIVLMWKVLNKEVDLGEPTSFLDHVCLGCTQRQCEISKDIVDKYRTMFESENFRISSWYYDMEGHAKKRVERYCVLANRTTQQLYKVSTPCIDDHHFKKKWNLLENCHKSALKLFQNVYTLHVLDDLIFYGQRTNLHDRLQNGPKPVTNAWIDWYLTFITHVNTNSIATWVILQSNADWDCFKTLILQEILRTQNPLLEEHCVFGSHTFVPTSWMCKKQTSVSHSSTESEIISLDAGLRLDGIPALDLRDLIVLVLGNTTQNHDRTVKPVVCRHKNHVRQ